MEFTALIQILVGLGIVGGMWRLNWTVAAMCADLKTLLSRVDDHESRLRVQEEKHGA